MSLKAEFNNIISTNSGKICEIYLFRNFMKAIQKKYKHHAYVKEYHGNKQQVSFSYKLPSIVLGNVVCELCDLLLIFEKENKEKQKEIRYTFLQAKYDKNGIRNQHFKCNLRQHYLLSQYPYITGINGFAINSTILQNHVTDSIGTFGIFKKDTLGFDMVYSIANNISLYNVKNINSIRKNRSYLHYVAYNPATKITNGYQEKIFCDNLDDFEIAANNMLVGNPVTDSDRQFITSIISSLIENDTETPIITDEYGNGITLSDFPFNVIYINLDSVISEEKSMSSHKLYDKGYTNNQ